MNGAHLHLLINHFPLFGLCISILLLALGLARFGTGFVQAGLVVAVLSGIFVVPTYLSGEPAEDIVEKAAGFSKDRVHEHEEAAEFAIWCVVATGLASAAGLYFSFKKGQIPKPLMIAIVVLNLFSLTVIARTNNLGGQISHPEIRDPNAQAPAAIESSEGH